VNDERNIKYGGWLRTTRRLRGYRTQQALAVASGIGRESIAQYECGLRYPTKEHLTLFDKCLKNKTNQK